MAGQSSGLIIGKFLPPHLGHRYLVDFARQYVDHLTVLVCTLEKEPIPGERRYSWMKEMFPDVEVLHHTDENPQEPHEHPHFWTIWHDSIRRKYGGGDYLFASEEYGFQLAEVLGMTYVPVNHDRTLRPVSGSAIRKDPMKHWEFIPEPVRPYYARRVCIFGPESAGKSTLTKDLAQKFQTAFVHEYARDLLELKPGAECIYEDIPRIARGQRAAEDAMVRQANRVLFCDTDLLTTVLWSEILFDRCPAWILAEANARPYDLYLVTAPDVPWVDDPCRYQPDLEERRRFLDRCCRELEARNRPYVLVDGSWEERFATAVKAVEELLVRNSGGPSARFLKG